MLEYLKLHNVGPAPEMEMNLARRLNFITGDNGLGKSFLLDIAWWVLTRTWARRVAIPPEGANGKSSIGYRYTATKKSFQHTSQFDRRGQNWPVKQGRPPIPGMVIYAQVDGGFSAWDPARNYWKKDTEEGPERPAAFRFTPDQVWDGLPAAGTKMLCNGLIRDWASWQHEKGEAFGQLQRVIRALSPSEKEILVPGDLTRVSLDDVRDHPTLRMPYGQQVPLVHASAGMRRIVALAYLLVWTWQEHRRASKLTGQQPAREIIFLIDEVEAHLHPQWQRRIIPSLLEVMTALTGQHDIRVQLVTATHSPLILASAETLFSADQDAWFDLDLVVDEGRTQVQLTPRQFVRRGDISNWLTSEAFDLREPRSLEAESAITQALELLRSPRPTSEQIDRVDALLRASLSDIDRFWVRWSEFRERRGAA